MRNMKTSTKTSLLIIIALALLASLVVFRLLPGKPDDPVGASVSESSRNPSFEVRVVMPRSAQPFFGILPDALVKKFDGTPRELRFDHASRGAEVGSVGRNRLDLRADGWNLFIEINGEGRIAQETHLIFPIALGGRQVSLRCQPADRATGYLHTNTRANADVLDGRFLVEIATCKNADSGRTTNWPPAPLSVIGHFESLPHNRPENPRETARHLR